MKKAWARLAGWFEGRAHIAALGALVVVSAAGKLVSTFRFLIYPDSYYYLLIARNLIARLSPAGTLGPRGMPFPPPGYLSMKLTYPLAVAGAMLLGARGESAGHIVSLSSAVLCVPAAYVATARVTASKWAGVAGAALAATSFGLTYWSGFVMSDSLSVLLGLLVVALTARERGDELSGPADIATGVVAALLVLSRPTYALTLPFLVWVGHSRFGWTPKRLATAAVSGSLTVAAMAALWFPAAPLSGGALAKVVPAVCLALLAAVLVIGLARRLRNTEARRRFGRIVPLLLAAAILAVYVAAALFVSAEGASAFPGIVGFASRDPAILLALTFGAFALARTNDVTAAGLLCSALVVLGVSFRVEPNDSRYLVQMLPFLIPVAAAGVLLLAPAIAPGSRGAGANESSGRHVQGAGGPSLAARVWERAAAAGVIIALLVGVSMQVASTVARPSSTVLRESYPQEVARRLRPALRGGDVLLAALPWPDYFLLGRPTWGAGVALRPISRRRRLSS